MGTTISSAILGPFVLSQTDNPLTITSSGSVTSTAAGADGVDGAAGTSWSVANSGSVSSSTAYAISLAGAGSTVANYGSISGFAGVLLSGGGSVTNNMGGLISTTGAPPSPLATISGVFVKGGLGTVSNAGTINSGGYGVGLNAGGTVTNSGGITGGEDGIWIYGAPGQLINTGSISATVDDGVGIFAGGSITNGVGASISGLVGASAAGAFITGGTGVVQNDGSIAGNKFGTLITNGGSVTNGATSALASITGGSVGVYLSSGGTLTNSAVVSSNGAQGVGAELDQGGGITNNASGSISGTLYGVFSSGLAGTIANSGSITGTKALYVGGGGTITNNVFGSITGQTAGLYFTNTAGTLINSGVVQALASGAAVELDVGGSVTNNAGGLISGGSVAYGVFVTGAAGSITNSGVIQGVNATYLGAGGTITNNAGGSISAQNVGAYLVSGGTINNSGAITASGSGTVGAELDAGGVVTNAAGGSISGGSYGVFVGGSVGGTVTNAGTISGGAYSVYFSSNNALNRVVVDSGAVFNGLVSGGNGTLELASGTGSITGINGGSFNNFQSVAVDAGGAWTLSGSSNSVATLTLNGTLAVTGALGVSSAIDPTSTGVLQLGAAGGGGVAEIASATGAGSAISFLGSSTLIIDSAATFGANVGSASYTGPQLQNFGAGDQIDIHNFSFANAVTSYNAATGVLQISNGSQVASLDFQNTTLGNGAFQIVSDGSGGVDINMGASAAPTISGTQANQTTVLEVALAPFASVTIADPNVTATDVLTITQSGGGVLSGAGLVTTAPGVYTLSGSASAITSALHALTFKPAAGGANTQNTTGFALSDLSSGFATPTVDTTTTVLDLDPPKITSASYTGTGGTGAWALTGGAQAGSVVTIFDGTTQLGTATANASGVWSYNSAKNNSAVRDFNVSGVGAVHSAGYWEGTSAANAMSITNAAGGDTIAGGGGADTITLAAHSGADTFIYTQASDSLVSAYDTITGLGAGDQFAIGHTPGTFQTVSAAHGTNLSNDLAAALNKHIAALGETLVTLTGAGGDAGTYLVINETTNTTFSASLDPVIKIASGAANIKATSFHA